MKITYVYDALCGWCYGFSPIMAQLYKKYKDSIIFDVVSGGMITGGRIGPIGEVAPYISWAYKDVEKACHVTFGEVFLNQTLKTGTAIFTSIPPAVALSIFKIQKPEESIAFAARLQKAIYYEGIEPENLNEYGKLAAEFGLDSVNFTTQMNNPENVTLAEADFGFSSAMGVNGFPTVFIEKNNKWYVLARGYMSFEKIEQNLQAVLNDI